MTVPVKEAPANYVPAAAVIRREQALSGITGCKQSGVDVSPLESKITYDSERCISCGACTSSCLSGALSMQAPDWKVVFQPDKCILCKLCLTACPLRLFHSSFDD